MAYTGPHVLRCFLGLLVSALLVGACGGDGESFPPPEPQVAAKTLAFLEDAESLSRFEELSSTALVDTVDPESCTASLNSLNESLVRADTLKEAARIPDRILADLTLDRLASIEIALVACSSGDRDIYSDALAEIRKLDEALGERTQQLERSG